MEFPIKSVADMEKLSKEVTWQYFEKIVGYIFEQNGFDVNVGVIVKDGYGIKRQFDVVAERYGLTYLIECKKWKSRKEYNSAIKSAVKKHMERCILFRNARGDGIPIIVTLIEGEVEMHEDVPIVPIMKLNWFINNVDQFIGNDEFKI